MPKGTKPSLFFLLLSLLLSPKIFARNPLPLQPQSPYTACKSTLYPKLCRSILSSFQHSPTNLDGYGKFSVKWCLKHAQKISDLTNHLLSQQKQSRFLSSKELNALHDCAQLSELTVDYLESISVELKSDNSSSGSDSLVGRVQALLSAVVTNQQTCYDGLVDSGSNLVGALIAPLSAASELYSVSLGLVTHALGRVRKAGKVLHGLNDSQRWGRNLAELVDKGLKELISERQLQLEIMGQGFYEEYVVVPKHKKSVMLIGDGINRTVISGNRNVVDGWTTFNSSTFALEPLVKLLLSNNDILQTLGMIKLSG
nr:probable pectinesterase/pectinesterase inhibitor 25 [Coffea arabica]